VNDPKAISRLRSWSPITHARSGLPPHLFIHGSDDGLVPATHSYRMHSRLTALDVASEYFEVPGGNHGLPPTHWEGTDRMLRFFGKAVQTESFPAKEHT
jgi:dipeptidyl aminopeptidase/acylaminoacyl peptidase